MPDAAFDDDSNNAPKTQVRTAKIPEAAAGTTEFRSMAEFLEVNNLNNGQVRIWYGELPIEFDVELKPNVPLLVTFHGAALKEPRLPWFVGYGLSAGLEISTVKFSDPSLYLNNSLRVSWYAGNKLQPQLQRQIHKVVSKLSRLSDANNLIFFGGSGGGYAALEAASSFDRSTAIVFNPTTIISESNPAAVSRYIQECWCGEPSNAATFDLVDRFITTPVSCNIYYLQNSTDTPHIERHMRPLLAALKPEHNLYLLFDDWGKGHIPPPKSLLRTVLEHVVNSEDQFGFIKLGFRSTNDDAWIDQISSTAKKTSLGKALYGSNNSYPSVDLSRSKIPERSTYLKYFDSPAGRNWDVSPLSSGGYRVVLPSKYEVTVTTPALRSGALWSMAFETQNSSNMLWLRSCWYSAEITRQGDVDFAIEILSSYHDWLKANNLDIGNLSNPSFDHCLALNLRTCAWMIIAADLDLTQSTRLKELVRDLLALASTYDRFLWNNHGIMLALAMIHASVASEIAPPKSHSISRLSRFLGIVLKNKVSTDGLVRENTALYQFLWAKWAWEIAHTFEYVLNDNHYSIEFTEVANKIASTAALFGIDSRSTLPVGNGNRRSGPAYGPSAGVLNGAEDGILVINDGKGNVFSYTAGSPTAIRRHVDEHALRLYYEGKELIADAGFNTYSASDPVSRCVTSQRGHSGLFFPQFDGLSGSEFYPANNPKDRSVGSLHVYEASPVGARLISNRTVDEEFTTQRHLEFDAESNSIKIRDFARAPREKVDAAPVARFIIPFFLEPSKDDRLHFKGNNVFIEFNLSPDTEYKLFEGNSELNDEHDEIRGIICPRPGQIEKARVLEISLIEDGKKSWEHEFSVHFGLTRG